MVGGGEFICGKQYEFPTDDLGGPVAIRIGDAILHTKHANAEDIDALRRGQRLTDVYFVKHNLLD